jgi:hypothetical protein
MLLFIPSLSDSYALKQVIQRCFQQYFLYHVLKFDCSNMFTEHPLDAWKYRFYNPSFSIAYPTFPLLHVGFLFLYCHVSVVIICISAHCILSYLNCWLYAFKWQELKVTVAVICTICYDWIYLVFCLIVKQSTSSGNTSPSCILIAGYTDGKDSLFPDVYYNLYFWITYLHSTCA